MEQESSVRYGANRTLDESSLLEISPVIENAPYLFGRNEPYAVVGGSFATRCVHKKPIVLSDQKNIETKL